jgi:hypothetical protein
MVDICSKLLRQSVSKIWESGDWSRKVERDARGDCKIMPPVSCRAPVWRVGTVPRLKPQRMI